jgi:heme/copper-type cytochrome/quinol oxidase subunit 2
VEITLSRERVTSFFKLCTGVYAAVIIASLAFLMDVREPDIVSGRTGLIVGCLFAAIVNMQQAESTLGQSEDITLTDTIHIISIVYILVGAMFALTAYLRCEAGREDFARHMDRRIHLPIFLSSFAVVNAVVIAYAAIIG